VRADIAPANCLDIVERQGEQLVQIVAADGTRLFQLKQDLMRQHQARRDHELAAGNEEQAATALKFKAELYQAILRIAKKYSQKKLQIILGEPQPRVSELLNGKIANKSVDKLLYYAGRLGIETKAKFVQTRKEVVEKELALAE